MLIQFCIDLAMIWLLRLGTISLFMVCFKLVIIISRMVILKFISLVLLFLIPLQFLLDNFITYCLRSKYSNLMVKKLRKFEKVDYSLWKCKLDLTLLITYLHNNIIPKTWYNSKTIGKFINFSCMILSAQNVLIPPHHFYQDP